VPTARGKPGFYRWSAKVTAVIDQHDYIIELGSRDRPLLTFVSPPDPTFLDSSKHVDWDVVACEWSAASYGV
jgi:hypothetical protein